MAKQRYRPNYDNMSYDNSSIAYTAAPVKEILALTAKKEADYLETKDTINLTNSLMKTMPFDPSSQGVYDEMVANVDNSLSAITPDNYSDNTLNTKQIAHDAMNKYGGIELAKQKQDYDSKAAAIAAFDIRPEKKAYKMAQMRANTKGITKDENGKFVVEPVPMPNLVPEIDLNAKMDGFMKDWKADEKYYYNPDGTLNVSKDLAGYLGITKTENITETELREGAMNFLALDPKIQEYLDDEADFMTKGQSMSVEDIHKALTPGQLESIVTGKKAKDITVEDIRLATEGNDGLLQKIGNHVLKQSIKDNIVKGYSDLYAKKYSYDKDTIDHKVDIVLQEMMKAKTAAANAVEVAPPLVTVGSYTTLQQLAPTSMVEIDKNIDAYAAAQPELMTNFNKFTTLLKTADTDAKKLGYRQKIAELKEELEKNDTAIQQAQEQKRNITESVFTIAESNGIGVDSSYEKEYPEIVKATDNINIGRMMTKGYTVPYDADVMTAVKRGGGLQPSIYDKSETGSIATAERLSQDYVIKDGNKYTYVGVPTASALRGANGKATEIYNDPKVKAKIAFKDNESYFKEPATKEQYREAVAKSYLNSDYESHNEDFVVNNSVNKLGNSLRKIKDVGEAKVLQTFDALYVDAKAGPKTAASEINEINAVLKTNILDNPSGYKVYSDNNELIDLPLHMAKLGIDMSRDYIDYEKFQPGVLLNADREYGQKLKMSIPLTAKGREKVRETMGGDYFSNSDGVALVGVDSTGKSGTFGTKLSNAVARTYAESFSDLSAGGEETRKALGAIAFNNSSYSKDFYALNLYSLAPENNVLYKTPDGNSVRINALRRSPNPKKMSDNDFFLTDAAETATFVYDKEKNTSNFIKNSVIENDKDNRYKIQTFASPEDIGSLLGKSMLNNQMYNLNPQAQQNNQVQTTGVSYSVAPGNIKASNYQSVVNNALKTYGKTAKDVLLTDATGKENSYSLLVPRSSLVDLRDYIPNNVDKQANLPYVNNRIVNQVAAVTRDFGLTLTSALRDAKLNKGTKGAADNSLHQYGFSVDGTFDAKAEAFIAYAEANPTELAAMGINFVYKHVIDGVPHLHMDFNS